MKGVILGHKLTASVTGPDSCWHTAPGTYAIQYSVPKVTACSAGSPSVEDVVGGKQFVSFCADIGFMLPMFLRHPASVLHHDLKITLVLIIMRSLIFQCNKSFQRHYGPEVPRPLTEMSTRNIRGVKGCRRVRLTTSQSSVKRLSRKCGML
jgi:hypothetical protein